MPDFIDRYIFENKDLRACYVNLEKTLSDNHANHSYPDNVQLVMNEFMGACALLISSLKIEGRIVLQCRSNSSVPLLMAECNNRGQLRAYAQLPEGEDVEAFSFRDLSSGTLAMTIQPSVNSKMGESYQGIVPMEAETLAGCLEHYFKQSEQLESCFYFQVEADKVVGFMLQQLPAQIEKEAAVRLEHWEEARAIAETLTNEELVALSSQEIMYRLYHQDVLRFLERMALEFSCGCSREKMVSALISLGREELESILLEQGQINMNCEFCQNAFSFNQDDVKGFFEEQQTLH